MLKHTLNSGFNVLELLHTLVHSTLNFEICFNTKKSHVHYISNDVSASFFLIWNISHEKHICFLWPIFSPFLRMTPSQRYGSCLANCSLWQAGSECQWIIQPNLTFTQLPQQSVLLVGVWLLEFLIGSKNDYTSEGKADFAIWNPGALEMIMVFERPGGGKTSTTSPFSDK